MRTKEQLKEYQKKYRIKNREYLVKKSREYRIKNKEKIFLNKKEYRSKNKEIILLKKKKYRNKNKESISIKAKKYRIENNKEVNQKRKIDRLIKIERYRESGRKFYKNNKEKVKRNNYLYKVKKLKIDIHFKLAEKLRNRLGLAIKSNQKAGSAVRDLGCTIPELKIYIEKQFKEGMNWGNWSVNGWHIDHIVPLTYFDLTNREEFLKACHFTNLQPMWGIENIRKGNKIL